MHVLLQNKMTALDYAVIHHNSSIVKLLVNLGADTKDVDEVSIRINYYTLLRICAS